MNCSSLATVYIKFFSKTKVFVICRLYENGVFVCVGGAKRGKNAPLENCDNTGWLCVMKDHRLLTTVTSLPAAHGILHHLSIYFTDNEGEAIEHCIHGTLYHLKGRAYVQHCFKWDQILRPAMWMCRLHPWIHTKTGTLLCKVPLNYRKKCVNTATVTKTSLFYYKQIKMWVEKEWSPKNWDRLFLQTGLVWMIFLNVPGPALNILILSNITIWVIADKFSVSSSRFWRIIGGGRSGCRSDTNNQC